MSETTVVHWDDRQGEPGRDWVYIGRKGGGPFGNPFADDARERNIALYREWFHVQLVWDEDFARAARSLRGKQLVCHCKPRACHGDVIKEWLDTHPDVGLSPNESGKL